MTEVFEKYLTCSKTVIVWNYALFVCKSDWCSTVMPAVIGKENTCNNRLMLKLGLKLILKPS